jgi:hypothetical protein
LLNDWKAQPTATRLMVSGFDKYTERSATSVEGASWIFRFDDAGECRARFWRRS